MCSIIQSIEFYLLSIYLHILHEPRFFFFLAKSILNASSEKCVSHVYNGYVNGEDQLTHGYSLRDTENDAKTRLLVWAPSDDILAHKSWETRPFILSKTQNYLCANQPAEESLVWRKPVKIDFTPDKGSSDLFFLLTEIAASLILAWAKYGRFKKKCGRLILWPYSSGKLPPMYQTAIHLTY